MTYETEIQKWVDKGYEIVEEKTTPFVGTIYTFLINQNYDKVRIYESGQVFKSDSITNGYELIYNFMKV